MPKSSRILRAFLGELSLELPGGLKPTPEHYQSLLGAVEGREDAHHSDHAVAIALAGGVSAR